ncbi:hypothetical protein IMG5_084970, partial [Ichthyophthirius multifiliis]
MGVRCHFAHGQEEIRNPALDPLVQYPTLAAIMSNPASLSSKMIKQMSKINIPNEYMAIVQRAAEILQVQNIQGCSQLLNEVINRN